MKFNIIMESETMVFISLSQFLIELRQVFVLAEMTVAALMQSDEMEVCYKMVYYVSDYMKASYEVFVFKYYSIKHDL